MQTNMPTIPKLEKTPGISGAGPDGQPSPGGNSWVGGMPRAGKAMPPVTRPPHRGQGFMQQGLPRGGIQPVPMPGVPPGSGSGGVVGDWGPGGTTPPGDSAAIPPMGGQNGMPGRPMPNPVPPIGMLGGAGNSGSIAYPQIMALLQQLFGGRA